MTTKWTAEESEILIRLWATGAATAAIAAELGRSPSAVSSAASARGLPPRLRTSAPKILWTEAEDARALALRDEGWSYARIGAELGRGECAVSDRISRIRNPKPPKVAPPPAGTKRDCMMCGRGM